MGLDAIVGAIASEAEARVAAIETETDAQVGRILDAAHDAADLDLARLRHARDEAAQRATARIVNRALLEADRQLSLVREGLFQQALDRLRSRLEVLVASPRYAEVLGALYTEAATVVADDDAVVLVRPDDQELIERLGEERLGKGQIEGSLRCLGGVDIVAKDGRAVRNTLDARLARSERELRHVAVQTIPELARIGVEP